MSEKTQVQIVNEEINRELTDPKTGQALLATTFKGLTAISMKQAIMEGMLLGFSFKNFLQKDVYAVPYGSGYSLITSIGFARKIATRTGKYCGKSKPIYVENDNKIDTCEITVKKMTNGFVGDYTSEVYFKEYSTGKNVWASKPHTMIAKVAEMQALRSAFPEELDKVYVEEEFEKGSRGSEAKDLVDSSNLRMKDITINESKNTKKKEVHNEDNQDGPQGAESDTTIIDDANPFPKK